MTDHLLHPGSPGSSFTWAVYSLSVFCLPWLAALPGHRRFLSFSLHRLFHRRILFCSPVVVWQTPARRTALACQVRLRFRSCVRPSPVDICMSRAVLHFRRDCETSKYMLSGKAKKNRSVPRRVPQFHRSWRTSHP